MDDQSIQKQIKNQAELFNHFLKSQILPEIKKDVPEPLATALVYSLEGSGKRIRPVLCMSAAGIAPTTTEFKKYKSELLVACAIECIHTYSLIHDDLPSMDDDDTRRGQKTVHKKFGEWLAILSGDALNTYAFELLPRIDKQNQVSKIVSILASCGGMTGMVAGQALDLHHENIEHTENKNKNLEILKKIHSLKTARLLSASCELGAILSGADPGLCEHYKNYGQKLGLLFQITDDLLDFHGDEKITGKAVGKDIQKGKWTYPGLLGFEKTKDYANEICSALKQLSNHLEPVGKNHDYKKFWKHLPQYILNRKK